MITPADRERCQAVVTAAHGPLVLGPRPQPERCRGKTAVVLTESKPDDKGEQGTMGLCADCYEVFKKRFSPDELQVFQMYRVEVL